MKLGYFLVMWGLCYAGWAQADIYKRVDADGHVTYSNAPLKGSKRIHLAPLSTFSAHSHKKDGKDSAAEFPRVDSATQQGRDKTRRQILEDELAAEEKALTEARNDLQASAERPEVIADKDGKVYPNEAKQVEKMNALQVQVQLHEKNIAALKTELSKK